MPVKIRLMRIGTNKRPFYRVVVCDERKKRTGAYIEELGTYNPLTEPKEIILKQNRIDEWVKKGAVLSDGFLRMTKQAPQRPPRPPKKQKKAEEKTSSLPEKLEDQKNSAKSENQTEPESQTSEKSDSSDNSEENK